MSVEILSVSQTRGNSDTVQDRVGGAKPLHRFINAQPQLVGITMLILGAPFIIMAIVTAEDLSHSSFGTIPPGYMVGAIFIICGILYIITEHNPTKKNVTISLALSIVAILVSFWTAIIVIPAMDQFSHYYYNVYPLDNMTYEEEESSLNTARITVYIVFMFYVFVGVIILIVMSSLAIAALRSSRSQAIVVMSTTANAAPAELQDEQSAS
ncbi:uncharacterized protein LOC144051107 isoform X1 [Vanacampus margaritifer]